MEKTTYIRARVYEEQWGGFIADYVRYFDDEAEVEAFEKETGHRVEILGPVTIG